MIVVSLPKVSIITSGQLEMISKLPLSLVGLPLSSQIASGMSRIESNSKILLQL